MILKPYNYKVEVADSGFAAIQIVRNKTETQDCCRTHRLILMDIDMPGKDGF
jgi:CheY-like chemotaxis protein